MPKKFIAASEYEISPHEFESSLKEVKVYITKLIEKYGEEARLCWNPWNHYPYHEEPSPIFELSVNREEIDEEYAERMKQEEIWLILQDKNFNVLSLPLRKNLKIFSLL